MECILYDRKKVRVSKKLPKIGRGKFLWVDTSGSSKKEIEKIKKRFNLHALSIEDALDPKQRPKIEQFKDYLFVVFKPLSYERMVKGQHVGVFLGKNFLITVHDGDILEIEAVKNKLKEGDRQLMRGSVDYLLYRILDTIVDDHLKVIDRVEEQIEKVEEALHREPSAKVFNKILVLRKELILTRKILWPEKDIFLSIEKGLYPEIKNENLVYFRDVHDHIVQAIDFVEQYRDLLASSLDLYLGLSSKNLNAIMKTLTILMSFVLIPSLIAGIYGMNFIAMPGKENPAGFFLVLVAMLFSVAVLFLYFSRKGWMREE